MNEKSELEKYCEEYRPDSLRPERVLQGMREGDYVESVRRAVESGALKLLELAEEWCKADPESSFNPGLSSWRLYDFLKDWCGDENTEP